MVVLAVGTALVARAQANHQAVEEAQRTTWVVAHAVAEPLLVPGIANGDADALAALDTAVRRFVLSESLVRVKIWDADGRILYSDAAALIGQRFALDPDELAALDQGEGVADVSALGRPENALEAGFGELLEVYLGLRTTTGQPVLFEAYYRYDAVVQQGWATWFRFAPLAVGALLVLQLVQLPLAFALARRLQRGERRRRQLLDLAVRASDAERRRIASDLHDGVVQDITGITYELDAVRIGAPSGHPDERDAILAGATRHLRGCVRSLRTMLLEIYPPNLAAEGLGPALADLAATSSRDGLTVQLHLDDAGEPPPHVAALLYRAAQEAIRNAVQHSCASRVDLVVVQHDDGIWELVVDDDGRGIEAGTLEQQREGGHLGLHALGELVTDAGGSLALHSAPHAGTRVEIRVPSR